MADGSVVFDVEFDRKQLESSLSSLEKDNAFLKKIEKVGFSIGSALGTAIKGGLAVLGAVGAGTVTLTKSAVQSVKELEQSLGGSEAVFSEYASLVQNFGKEAFKTLGLAQSDYLATANKMGSLFQGLGFEIGESTNLTIQTMQRAADVASVMGIDVAWAMESIAGAAKGNFTMMDNLGVAVNNLTLENYALEKGIEASVEEMSTQEKISLAMQLFLERTAYATGRYAEENNTLAGSFTTLGAAWKNFLAGTGENSVDDLVWSLDNAFDVLSSNLEEIIPRLGEVLPDMMRKLSPILSELLQTVLPSLTKMVIDILPPIADALGEVAKALAPALFDGILSGFFGEENARKVKNVIDKFFGIDRNKPKENVNTRMMEAAAGIDISAQEGMIPDIGFGLWDRAVEKLYERSQKRSFDLATLLGISSAGAEVLPSDVTNANDNFASAFATDFQQSLVEQFQSGEINYEQLKAAAFPADFAMGAESGIEGAAGSNALASGMIEDILSGLATGQQTLSQKVKEMLSDAQSDVDVSGFNTVGDQISRGIATGIKNGTSAVTQAVKDVIAAALAAAEAAADINSPSGLFRDRVGLNIAAGTAVGVENNLYRVRKAVDAMVMGSLPDAKKFAYNASFDAPAYHVSSARNAQLGFSRGQFVQNNTFNVPTQTPDEFARTMHLYATYGMEGVIG